VPGVGDPALAALAVAARAVLVGVIFLCLFFEGRCGGLQRRDCPPRQVGGVDLSPGRRYCRDAAAISRAVAGSPGESARSAPRHGRSVGRPLPKQARIARPPSRLPPSRMRDVRCGRWSHQSVGGLDRLAASALGLGELGRTYHKDHATLWC
jgi:hypothetical protein